MQLTALRAAADAERSAGQIEEGHTMNGADLARAVLERREEDRVLLEPAARLLQELVAAVRSVVADSNAAFQAAGAPDRLAVDERTREADGMVRVKIVTDETRSVRILWPRQVAKPQQNAPSLREYVGLDPTELQTRFRFDLIRTDLATRKVYAHVIGGLYLSQSNRVAWRVGMQHAPFNLPNPVQVVGIAQNLVQFALPLFDAVWPEMQEFQGDLEVWTATEGFAEGQPIGF